MDQQVALFEGFWAKGMSQRVGEGLGGKLKALQEMTEASLRLY
jgi:hypothetical protein